MPLAAQSRNIRFQRISIEQGLSQGTVNCMLQDRIGFMWFGTQGGLDRYDGTRFESLPHDPDDPATLSDNWILSLIEDAGTGDLWIGTQTGGLSRWRRTDGTFTHFRHDPGDPASLAANEVRALAQTSDGSLWIGTAAGLDRLDPGTGILQPFRHDPTDPASLSDDEIRALVADRHGRVWVGTLGGLNRLDPATGTFTRFRHDGDPVGTGDVRVRSLLEDRDGSLWVGTFGGLDRLDPATGAFEHFRHDPAEPSSLSEGRVRALFQDRDGRLWIGTDSALDLFDPATRSFIHYRHDPADPGSLGADRIMSIFQDRSEVLWVGTQGGLHKWSPRTWSFSHYKSDASRPSSLASDKILSISVDPDGAVWIGTNGHGLDRFDRRTGHVTHFTKDSGEPGTLSDDIVTALCHDRDGVLWAGTQDGGLNRFDRAATGAATGFDSFVHDPERDDSLGADGVMSIFESSRAELWIGTYGGGLNRLDRRTATFERFRHDPADPSSLSNDRVTVLGEDAEGFLWAGTLGSGLNRLERERGTFLRVHHRPRERSSLSDDVVMAIHLSPAGALWIGTQSGLNRLERLDEASGEAVFRRYLKSDGLPDEFIYGIYTDRAGGLWLSTNRGLARLDLETESFKCYDTSHGLQAEEFNMNAHFQSSDGELFFGGTGGFNAFYPDRIEPNTAVPPVVLTSFSKLNRPVRLERPIFDLEEVTLSHRDTLFSFELAALDYTAPQKNRYRYRLEGFDDDWIDLGHRRRVSFTNLDPGRYKLRVQGSNNDGVWNEAGTSIRVVIAPPPWRTWWAYTFYALALAAIVRGFVRSQQRKVERERQIARRERSQADERGRLIAELEAKNAELERFNYTVSHDLKSPLVTIKGFLGLLQKDAHAGDLERLDHDVKRIAAAADRMRTLLEELLELSRVGRQVNPPQEVPMGELARDAVEQVGGLIAERGVKVRIAPDLPPAFGDRTRLFEVYQNLLENAVRYMGDQTAPRIDVGVERNGRPDPVFFVRDNGVGIEAKYHSTVFELFQRLDAHTEGTGVGLTLVKRIIELHGGRVWVESPGPGQGSTFRFTLPTPVPTPPPGSPDS